MFATDGLTDIPGHKENNTQQICIKFTKFDTENHQKYYFDCFCGL